jgi:hypothetical protein
MRIPKRGKESQVLERRPEQVQVHDVVDDLIAPGQVQETMVIRLQGQDGIVVARVVAGANDACA